MDPHRHLRRRVLGHLGQGEAAATGSVLVPLGFGYPKEIKRTRQDAAKCFLNTAD